MRPILTSNHYQCGSTRPDLHNLYFMWVNSSLGTELWLKNIMGQYFESSRFHRWALMMTPGTQILDWEGSHWRWKLIPVWELETCSGPTRSIFSWSKHSRPKEKIKLCGPLWRLQFRGNLGPFDINLLEWFCHSLAQVLKCVCFAWWGAEGCF